MRGALRCSFENASLYIYIWSLSFVILTNREPSKLAAEHIFCALQVRTRLYQKIVALKKFFVCL